MTILETKNLGFSYESNHQVLDRIDIELKEKTFNGILGANGSGKTTLLHQLCGLLKPTKGHVMLKGTELRNLKDTQIFKTIGILFQNPDNQLFCLTVSEDVAYGVANLGIKGAELQQRVAAALELVDITALKDREIYKLSFGQKKRVALAGVLAMQPEVLLLDEPTAGLEPMAASNLIKLLMHLQQHNNITVVMSTHEVDWVPLCCDNVYVMEEGRIVLQGKPGLVFSNKELLRQCGLRLPRIGHLMEILKAKDDVPVDTTAMTIAAARKEFLHLFQKG
jgi:cobalt transport protein ATP-binding subunit